MDTTVDLVTKFSRTSLRVRVALGVALPICISLLVLSFTHYARERQLLDEQITLTTIQIGEITLGSLHHVMLENDRAHMDQLIEDIGAMENIQRVLLINDQNRIVADSTGQPTGIQKAFSDSDCSECHQVSLDERPRTIYLQTEADTLRISSPINNDPECRVCHGDQEGHLGMLLIDVSLLDINRHVLEDLRIDAIVTIAFTVVITAGVYLLIHWLVVRRIEHFRGPLEALATGDFGARLPTPDPPIDELDVLATTTNRMASELEKQLIEQEERHQLHHRAIVEERERIARDIHDGVAQLMGYVNNKAAAAIILLRQGRNQDALNHLEQLDSASQQAFTELRAAILNLRTSDSPSTGLIGTLQAYATNFSELTDIQVDLSMPVENKWKLSPDIELNLLRITQEALSNVQKHSKTDLAWIHLRVDNGILELSINDDGIGFELHSPPKDHRPHFGLNNMRARADSIGASFEVVSEPAGGTRVIVRLPLKEV